MVNTHDKTPRGIRNNNPGNLRSAVGPDFKTTLVDGFAHFETMENGCRSLFYLINQYYTHLGLRTLDAFIGRYAPASENDVAMYVREVGKRLALNPLSIRTTDLFLNRPWRAIDMARAIIAIECGQAPASIASAPEWIGPSTLADALRNTGKWSTL